jgi:hypothetical protein
MEKAVNRGQTSDPVLLLSTENLLLPLCIQRQKAALVEWPESCAALLLIPDSGFAEADHGSKSEILQPYQCDS